MNQIEDYIIVKNTISKEICQSLIDENNKKEWRKHTWNNYTTGETTSESTKELDVMSCTSEQQAKVTPALIQALGTNIKTYVLGKVKRQVINGYQNLVLFVLINTK